MGQHHHYHRQSRRPSWLWWLLGLGVVIWLLQPQVDVDAPLVGTDTRHVLTPEIQRVEVEVDRPASMARAFLSGKQYLSDSCCRVTFTHKASYETGNDNWFDTDILLDDEVEITTTLIYGYELSVDLSQAEIGNIKIDSGDQFSARDPKKNTYIQVFLPKPVPVRPILIGVTVQLPDAEIQNAIEWLTNHGDDERKYRNYYLTDQAIKDAQAAFEKHNLPTWQQLQPYMNGPVKLRHIGSRFASEMQSVFTQKDGDMTWVQPQWQ